MKRSRLTYFLPLAFAVFWGLTFIWSEQILEVYSPITMTFLRMTLASVFLFIFVKFTKKLERIKGKDLRWMILIAFCEPFLYFIGESYGIVHSSASFAAIILATIPLFVPFGVWLFFGIRSSWTILTGLMVSFIGIFYMILGEDGKLLVDVRGVLFLSLAVFSAVIYSLLIQKMSAKYNQYTIVFYQTFLAALMFFPLFAGFGWKEFQSIPFDFSTYKNLAMLAIFGSGVAFICFVASIKEFGAVKTALFTNLIPVVAAIAAFLLLDKIFTWQEIIGMSIVILGLFVSQIKWRKKTIKDDKNRDLIS
jgi:drug/metabolite transporter (DMT)-like permease